MSETPTDADLLERLRGGDSAAFEAISQRYWAAIQRYCRTYLNDPARADDVTQETFTKLNDPERAPTGDVRPWLYRVARNRCLDILRHQHRSPTHANRIQTGFQAAQSEAGPRTRVAKMERAELIRAIIDEMPEEFRGVLILKFYEGLSRTEMAAALDVSEQTVKGRLVRASKHLEEELRRITGSWT